MEAEQQLEAKKMLKYFTYAGRKRFTFCTCGRPQCQKTPRPLPNNHPQLSGNLNKIS